MPTNFAFAPDGGFFVADGYGSYRIHRYDKDEANGSACLANLARGIGQFNLPHGIWIDDRNEGDPTIVVSDRANARLQWFTLAGVHLLTQEGFMLPANNDVLWRLDGGARSGQPRNSVKQRQRGDCPTRRRSPTNSGRSKNPTTHSAFVVTELSWVDGKFIHPHDACFDSQGNIFVAEWVHSGRITKLRKLG